MGSKIGMKKHIISAIFVIFFSFSAYSQTVTFTDSDGLVTFTFTPCSKKKALDTIDFFMDIKPFYHFTLDTFDYQNALNTITIINGTISDFEKVYNGFSYGSATIGYMTVNCIMYGNLKTGQYSLLQFADVDLGGGVVRQNLKSVFERSIVQVDTKQ